MRIIAGSARGRPLKVVEAPGLRPAMGSTREALFSMLEARGLEWEKTRALDLFAGCGSLALECLSRGAQEVWLVDNAREACACCAANIEKLGMANARLFKADVAKFLRQTSQQPFDVVFVDPPYHKNLVNGTFAALARGGWLRQGSFIVAEIEKGLILQIPENFAAAAEKLIGQTSLNIWICQ